MPGHKPGIFALRLAAFRLFLRLLVMRQVFCPQSTPKRRYYHAEIQSGPTSRLDCGPYNLCHGSTTAVACADSATISITTDHSLQAADSGVPGY
jgi:hypothetical protein